MKRQDTVNRNFQKNILQWEESRRRKVQNLKNEVQKIDDKINRLESQKRYLTVQIGALLEQLPPKPPTVEERSSQYNDLRKLYPDASDETLKCISEMKND